MLCQLLSHLHIAPGLDHRSILKLNILLTHHEEASGTTTPSSCLILFFAYSNALSTTSHWKKCSPNLKIVSAKHSHKICPTSTQGNIWTTNFAKFMNLPVLTPPRKATVTMSQVPPFNHATRVRRTGLFTHQLPNEI